MAKEKEQKKEVSKKDTKKATAKKETKKSIFKSISSYFKGVKKEVSRIRWTKGKDLLKYSITYNEKRMVCSKYNKWA